MADYQAPLRDMRFVLHELFDVAGHCEHLGNGLDRELILSILSDGKYSFDPVPRNTLSLATFMHDVGALKTRPESWKDYFFEDLHDREGS